MTNKSRTHKDFALGRVVACRLLLGGLMDVNTVEIVEGLKEGDRVVLSDTSAWDAFDRIHLN